MAEEFETLDMFSKLLHQSQSQSNTNPFQLPNECKTSEDDDSHSSGGPTQKPASSSPTDGAAIELPRRPTQKPASSSLTGGATDELQRRPRGRPPGSRNKPKQAVMAIQEPGLVMSPCMLEIPSGNEVVESLRRFSIRNNTGLCVLKCSGSVVNVLLRQPSLHDSGTPVYLQGCFEIITLSGIILPHSSPAVVSNGFSITFAGHEGRIAGGFVIGRLIAAGTVFVVAAPVNNQCYHRLSLEEEVRNTNSVYGVGDVLSPPVTGGAEAIWAPMARAPPPPPF
ncbi:unnamed protein product [Lupinus luteus]|uniref:PPC domain-containing protein n=1 Tax=Lupinus luteus TaxID=3873 RepID=A0AAV1X1L4_LUPLU